ncbi:cell division protein FtsB [Thermodesulfovibrio aggregans]|uniref:Cell division protein FtsB n=1 Tax=Thermodesulfovibrio aggregans TaxID=86166 RepID=A0A0U9HTW2_9BACT|nr:septum formation initiator family protein [Thermodesulfovibrio aggregans]GAQ93981.1 cell division protein FtsB [Thermodesulfovibrio aggregans]
MKRRFLKEQLLREKKRNDRIFLFFFLVIILFLAYSFFFGDMGYLKYLELKKNEQKLMKDINQILMENNALKNEIELLKKDPSYMEKYAREKFGLVKPGEMVFQFQKEEK